MKKDCSLANQKLGFELKSFERRDSKQLERRQLDSRQFTKSEPGKRSQRLFFFLRKRTML